MAAAAWAFYNSFKRYLGNGTLDMNTDLWRISLYTSASNAATVTLSRQNQLTNEVAEANGYSSSGLSLSAPTWSIGTTSGTLRFDSTAVIWTAAAGSIADVKFAVIWKSDNATSANRKLVCQSQLSTAQFSITTGNTLTITPATTGIFELT